MVVITPILVYLYCVPYQKWKRRRRVQRLELRNEREAQRRIESDLEISRIEANVKKFSDIQQKCQRKILHRILKRQQHCVVIDSCSCSSNSTGNGDIECNATTTSNNDIESGDDDSSTSDNDNNNSGPSCSICLEHFVNGEIVVHSINRNQCQHIYHPDCILNWLSASGAANATTALTAVSALSASSASLSDDDDVNYYSNNPPPPPPHNTNIYSCPCCRQQFIRVPATISPLATNRATVSSSSMLMATTTTTTLPSSSSSEATATAVNDEQRDETTTATVGGDE